jgi:hypothetical protein
LERNFALIDSLHPDVTLELARAVKSGAGDSPELRANGPHLSFERAVNRCELGVEFGAKPVDDRNNSERDPSRDQSVFYRDGARFVGQEFSHEQFYAIGSKSTLLAMLHRPVGT